MFQAVASNHEGGIIDLIEAIIVPKLFCLSLSVCVCVCVCVLGGVVVLLLRTIIIMITFISSGSSGSSRSDSDSDSGSGSGSRSSSRSSSMDRIFSLIWNQPLSCLYIFGSSFYSWRLRKSHHTLAIIVYIFRFVGPGFRNYTMLW